MRALEQQWPTRASQIEALVTLLIPAAALPFQNVAAAVAGTPGAREGAAAGTAASGGGGGGERRRGVDARDGARPPLLLVGPPATGFICGLTNDQAPSITSVVARSGDSAGSRAERASERVGGGFTRDYCLGNLETVEVSWGIVSQIAGPTRQNLLPSWED